jgi:hypothetical protein
VGLNSDSEKLFVLGLLRGFAETRTSGLEATFDSETPPPHPRKLVTDGAIRALAAGRLHGAFRRSELVSLDVSDLKFTPEGLLITLTRSKTRSGGPGLGSWSSRSLRTRDLRCGSQALCPFRGDLRSTRSAGTRCGPDS